MPTITLNQPKKDIEAKVTCGNCNTQVKVNSGFHSVMRTSTYKVAVEMSCPNCGNSYVLNFILNEE